MALQEIIIYITCLSYPSFLILCTGKPVMCAISFIVCFKDANNSVEAEQELLSQKSVHVIEQERRRKRLLFIALVALIAMGLLALAAAIPFLLGEICRMFQ